MFIIEEKSLPINRFIVFFTESSHFKNAKQQIISKKLHVPKSMYNKMLQNIYIKFCRDNNNFLD